MANQDKSFADGKGKYGSSPKGHKGMYSEKQQMISGKSKILIGSKKVTQGRTIDALNQIKGKGGK